MTNVNLSDTDEGPSDTDQADEQMDDPMDMDQNPAPTATYQTKMSPREQLQAFLSWNDGIADSTKIMEFIRFKQWHISYHKIILAQMQHLPLARKRPARPQNGNPRPMKAVPTPGADTTDFSMISPTEINTTTMEAQAASPTRETHHDTTHSFSIRATFRLPGTRATLFNPRLAMKELHTKLMECPGSIHTCHLTDNSTSFASMEQFPDKDNFSKFFNVQAHTPLTWRLASKKL